MSDNIPLGICREILLRLPAISLLRFRAVSKRWRAVIDDPCFVKAHININQFSSNSTTIIIRNSTGYPFSPLYYFDLAALNFTNGPQTTPVTPLNLTPSGLSHLQALPVAACNGLILIAPECRDRNRDYVSKWDPKGTWEITNLLTRERLTLPQLNFNSQVLGIGLGYDYAADDYKVVVIDCECDDVNNKSLSQTHVYSLKLDSWRKIGNCPYNFLSQEKRHGGGRNIQHGVFLKGALHWVSDDEIIVLDVGTETYHQLALPPLQMKAKMKPKSMQLDVLGGCLCLSYFVEEGNMERWGKFDKAHFDAWVMNDYGSQDSWIKLFKLRGCDVSYTYRYLRPVAYMKNKNGVLLNHHVGLFWFDVWSNGVKEVNIHGICRNSKNYSAQVFVGSLFRLHDSCGRAASKGRTREKEMKMQMADTKLTFCVRDFVTNNGSPPNDMCYRHDRCYSPLYRYNSPSKVCAASFIPDADSTTLSLDVCCEILLRLPAKSLLRCRAVCKAWCAVIDEPCFVRAHTNKQLSSNSSNVIIRNSTGPPFHPLYSFDLNDLKFANGLQKIVVAPLDFTHSGLSLLRAFPVSACNGLILVAGKSWEIWNPLTHERLKLLRGKCNTNLKGEAIGLGYDYATDDYKVVVIHGHRLHRRRHGRDNFARQTHVYSLRSDSWRNVENYPHYDDDCLWNAPRGPGVFLCGALHWTRFNSPYGIDTIIAFDLGTENFRQLQAPPFRKREHLNDQKRYLNVMDGCLVVSDFAKANSIGDELEHYDVWMLKDYEDKDSWIKLLSFEDEECMFYSTYNKLRPVAFMNDKTQILLQYDWWGWRVSVEDYHCRFLMFDFESNSMKRVDIHGLTGTFYAQIIDRTIFRLHDNCGVNESVRTRRRRRIGKRTINMMMSDTELNFCVRDAIYLRCYHSHDSCYSLDPNWDHSSGEGQD